MFNLNNTSALIAGGASGLGAATARLLSQNGAKVILIDQNESMLNTIAKEINGIGIVCDVTDATAVEKAVTGAASHGPLRMLINCAGIAPAERIVGREGVQPLEHFKKVIDINLIGTFNVMRCAAAVMMQLPPLDNEERGVIINTASVAAYDGQIGQAAYSASKGGVVSMTLPAARELAKWGIRVLAIAPGIFDTPMLRKMPEQVQNSLAASVPFPKRFGKPEEYAHLVLSIIHNPMLNGEVIRLDGALRMNA